MLRPASTVILDSQVTQRQRMARENTPAGRLVVDLTATSEGVTLGVTSVSTARTGVTAGLPVVTRRAGTSSER